MDGHWKMTHVHLSRNCQQSRSSIQRGFHIKCSKALQLESYCAWLQAKESRMYTYDSVQLQEFEVQHFCLLSGHPFWPISSVRVPQMRNFESMHAWNNLDHLRICPSRMYVGTWHILAANLQLSHIQDHLACVVCVCAYHHCRRSFPQKTWSPS